MTAPTQVVPWARPAQETLRLQDPVTSEAWHPPFDSAELQSIRRRMHMWEPFDADALLDDVGTALDEVPPSEEGSEELAQRLRGHLMRLIAIAVSGEADRKDSVALRLLEQARTVWSQDMPGDRRTAIGHVRRMAWTVNELLERLLATRHVTNVNAR
ncbi:DUF6415 family natural product biosynthesis protein [Streptomyces sp. NPDC060035]|uniref:DUF6415 family natural product biosynthesis protein n=1 Tax=Streptomyces sp. NPDC060035 TaxID=3347044 RepID=UPI00367CA288